MQFAAAAANSKAPVDAVNSNKENIKSKQILDDNDKKVVVPVAQFEAFKVYEDEPTSQAPKLPKHVDNNPYNIYKDQIGNRFITKTELAEIEGKPKPKEPSPMSVEKSENVEPKEPTEVVTSSRSSRDIFFEMEEYRASIYQYLREHEVSFCKVVYVYFFFSHKGRNLKSYRSFLIVSSLICNDSFDFNNL